MGVRASAPLRRKRGSEAPSPAAEPPLELAIISDPGEDLDDELAMVYLRHLVALYPSLVVRCVVCNLRPARKRAALMRQTLDALNMKHVPVGVGDDRDADALRKALADGIRDGIARAPGAARRAAR